MVEKTTSNALPIGSMTVPIGQLERACERRGESSEERRVFPVCEHDVVGMLDVLVWGRGAESLGLRAVSRVATMPPCPARHRRLASRDREHAFRGGTAAHAFHLVSFSAAYCVFSLDSLRLVGGLVGVPLRLLLVPTKKKLHGGSRASVADLRDPDELLRAEEGEAACTAVAEILARFPMPRLRQEPKRSWP
jgi:hypothetical protein